MFDDFLTIFFRDFFLFLFLSYYSVLDDLRYLFYVLPCVSIYAVSYCHAFLWPLVTGFHRH